MHAIVANGFAEGPAQALRDYLVAHGAEVTTIFHPLSPEHGGRHVITRYAEGQAVEERSIDVHVRPPRSYALDLLVPLLPPRVETWFGFNPLACGRGLLARRLGRAGSVFLWSVDFVPDRFGAGTVPTRIYDRVDRFCCTHADARVELSEAARYARNLRHGVGEETAPVHLVPMGAWLERTPTTSLDAYESRRVVFLGHLVPRQGVDVLLEALALLKDVRADVIGSGPLEQTLRRRAAELGLSEAVRFHSFVPDHRDVERVVADAAIAVAPYRPEDTFTRYADPGKLKTYLAAGLPIVLTDVPPNAQTLAREAGADVAAFDSQALANAIEAGLANPDRWRERRSAALSYVSRFDWEVLLSDLLEKLHVAVP